MIKSDIQIAREAKMKPIRDVLEKVNVPDDPAAFSPMGRHIAKLNLEYVDKLKEKKGNLILVTAITPTPAGEGKTTTSVGLSDGLNKIGKKNNSLFKRTKFRTFVWNERWRSRRRICPSCTNGTNQFTFYW